jgi:hypothetical protein
MTSDERVVYADGMSPEDIAALLARVTPDLDAVAAPWTVIGSGALILLGVPLGAANDLDIVTSAQGAGRLRARWSEWLKSGVAKLPDGPFRSEDFARYETPWGPAEVMGGLKVRGEPLVITACHADLPIPTAQEQLRILHLFGRPKDLAKAAQLEAWLSPG